MRIHRFKHFGFGALTLLAGVTPGCEGGQTGDLSGEHGSGTETGSAGGCDEHKQKLAGFDAMTDAGSAEQMLAYAEKTFDAPLTWKSGSDGSWTVGPESGQGRIHVQVERGANAYELTYSEPQTSSGATLDIAVICPPPQLGVEAHVTVTTDGGALAESFDTLLRTSSPGVASLSVPLDLTKLDGSLAVSYSQPRTKLVQTSLEATLMAEGTTGRISGIVQVDSGSGAVGASSASQGVLAVWPNAAACAGVNQDGSGLGMPPSAEALGFTGTETLASLAPAAPVAATWLDGKKGDLSVGIESAGDGCFRVRNDLPLELGGGAGVTYPVTIALKSADGRLDGSYEGQVVATGSGAQREVSASAYMNLAVADVKKSGFADVKVPDGTDALLLQVDLQLVGDSATGSVKLLGLTNPPCLTEPPPSTPGAGASAPGCAGQTRTPLETASWGG